MHMHIVYKQYVYVYYMYMYTYSYLLVYICAFMKCIYYTYVHNKLTLSKHQDYYCYYYYILLLLYLCVVKSIFK